MNHIFKRSENIIFSLIGLLCSVMIVIIGIIGLFEEKKLGTFLMLGSIFLVIAWIITAIMFTNFLVESILIENITHNHPPAYACIKYTSMGLAGFCFVLGGSNGFGTFFASGFSGFYELFSSKILGVFTITLSCILMFILCVIIIFFVGYFISLCIWGFFIVFYEIYKKGLVANIRWFFCGYE